MPGCCWGTRVSLVAGFVSVAIAVLADGVLGTVAGSAGGRIDAVDDTADGRRALYLRARLMRGQVLAVSAGEYVDAARALGAPGSRIAWRHVLPNAVTPIVVQGLAQRGLRQRARRRHRRQHLTSASLPASWARWRA